MFEGDAKVHAACQKFYCQKWLADISNDIFDQKLVGGSKNLRALLNKDGDL